MRKGTESEMTNAQPSEIEKEFWTVIDSAGNRAACLTELVERLGDELGGSDSSRIIRFSDTMSKKIADACTFPLLAANFVISSFVSDDGFYNFRAWLVAMGRERYTLAVHDPETIADWLDVDSAEEVEECGENIVAMLEKQYYASQGQGDYLSAVESIADPAIQQHWPESKSEYMRRFPKLVQKYWNQAKINELHAD